MKQRSQHVGRLGGRNRRRVEEEGQKPVGGALLAVTEDAKLGATRVRGRLVDADRAMALSYVRSGRFKPTDFAVSPSGDVIAFER